MALLRKARLSTPMIPTKLTAIPTSTMTMRPPTLDVAPRLPTLIKKPNNVTTSPAMIIFLSPRSGLEQRASYSFWCSHTFALQKNDNGNTEQHEGAQCVYDPAAGEGPRHQDKANQKTNDRDRLCRIRSHRLISRVFSL